MDKRDYERERRKQRRLEQIGTNKPRCEGCGETDWRCFEVTSIPHCAKCHIKATVDPDDKQLKQRRLKKLGTNEPGCAMCGETDWRCIEQHHVAGRKRDPMTALLCANDHLRVTDEQIDHPSSNDCCDPLLDKIGHFLLGLADMLRVIVERLVEFGHALIDRARTQESPANRSTS